LFFTCTSIITIVFITILNFKRIYGTAWESLSQLKLFKQRQEEAKRRDHRLVGKNLNLFSIQEDAGGGLVFWHPKGSVVRRNIEDYWKDVHVKV
jgi:threonyl-tRNA synthetase